MQNSSLFRIVKLIDKISLGKILLFTMYSKVQVVLYVSVFPRSLPVFFPNGFQIIVEYVLQKFSKRLFCKSSLSYQKCQ